MISALFLIGLAMQAPPAPHYRILSECDPSAEVRAEIQQNTPMAIGFSIAGSPACYSVTATVGGKQIHGYVLDRSLDAIQAFDKARVADEREAFSRPPVPAPPPAPPAETADSKKQESKPSKETVGKEQKKEVAEKNPLKKTPRVDF